VAKLPAAVEELKEKYGPHLNYNPPGGWQGEAHSTPEKLVRTHCCFCGRLSLRGVLPQLGFDYATPGPAEHWQALCPACKRKTLAVAQMRIREEARG
jgi:hypothetical protein